MNVLKQKSKTKSWKDDKTSITHSIGDINKHLDKHKVNSKLQTE